VTDSAAPVRGVPVRRAAELTVIARNAARILAGARMADGQALGSLSLEADASLRDARAGFALPPQWTLGNRLTTVADVAVVEVCHGPELVAVLKLARTPAGDASLLLQQETLHRLAGDTRLGAWRRLLPGVLAHGVVGTRRYSIEQAVPGTVGTSLPDRADESEATRNAVRAVSELHRSTGRVAVASRELVDRWLEPGLSLVADVPMLLGPARRRRLVDLLRERIRSGVEGRALWVGRTHGDYFPGNILFGPSAEVTGIIDWGQSRDDDLALIDPGTLLVAGRAGAQGTALGRVVRDLCRGAALSAGELALLELHRAACPADPVGVDVMALLTWLRHVENNLLKSPRYGSHPAWVHANLETVLRTAAGRAD
jgi:Ser/Thr protein kinase RdoA (MazF antagonist)